MPQYKLHRRFYDGKKVHPVGSVLFFEEGKQPRTATLVEDAKPEPKKEPEKEPELAEPPAAVENVTKPTALSELAKKGK